MTTATIPLPMLIRANEIRIERALRKRDELEKAQMARQRERVMLYREKAEDLESIVEASPLHVNVIARLLTEAMSDEGISPERYSDPQDRADVAGTSKRFSELASRSRDLLDGEGRTRADRCFSIVRQRPFLVKAIGMANARLRMIDVMPKWHSYRAMRAGITKRTWRLFVIEAIVVILTRILLSACFEFLTPRQADSLFATIAVFILPLCGASIVFAYIRGLKKLPADFDSVHEEFMTQEVLAQSDNPAIWEEIKQRFGGTTPGHLQGVLEREDKELEELLGPGFVQPE
ncbi:MAG: hypothetical protein WC712_03155 [Candidatus Brocadiia bacterium]